MEFFLGPIEQVDNNQIKVCFYVVNHTARFESVNLNMELFNGFKKKLPGMKIILIAMTPGTSSISAPASQQLSTGESIITLWYNSGTFNHNDNLPGYEMMRSTISSLKSSRV